MKIRKLHIGNFKVFQNFDIDFTDKNGDTQSLIVLAGINGSGKTTLLKDVIYPLLQEKKDASYPIRYDKTMPRDTLLEIEYGDKAAKTIETITAAFFEERLVGHRAYDETFSKEYNNIIWYSAGISQSKNAKKSIVQYIDKLIYEQDKKSSEAYHLTQEILRSLFRDFELQIEFSGLDRRQEVLFKNERSERITIENLSSGEQELITKIFSLYLDDIKNHIILIDEPESSLHPSWQSRIASLYQEFADKNNNQVILATHSPHIVASVQKEQVRVLVKTEEGIQALDSFIGSYGWRVDRVLLEIFGLKGLRTPLIEKKLDELRQLLFSNHYEKAEYKNLERELISVLGYDDMDLVLIRMEAAKRKMKREAD